MNLLSKKQFIISLFPACLTILIAGCYQAAAIDNDSDFFDSDSLPSNDSDFQSTDSNNINDSDFPDSDSLQTDTMDTETEPAKNYALVLDGDGDYVRIPHDDVLNLSDEWTIESWIFIDEMTSVDMLPILRKGDESISISAYFLYARYQSEFPIAGYGTSSSEYVGLTSTELLQPGIWIHMAFTFDNGESQFFINGNLINSLNDDRSVKIAPFDLIIGAILTSSNKGFFNGMLDEIRISDIARYNAGFEPQTVFTLDDNTLALWHFNEGSGTTTTDEAGNLTGTLVDNAHFKER